MKNGRLGTPFPEQQSDAPEQKEHLSSEDKPAFWSGSRASIHDTACEQKHNFWKEALGEIQEGLCLSAGMGAPQGSPAELEETSVKVLDCFCTTQLWISGLVGKDGWIIFFC